MKRARPTKTKPMGFAAMDVETATAIRRKGGKTVAKRRGHMASLAALRWEARNGPHHD